jgi:protein phosphatase 1 regulatory subunit 3A/B/C/D/E
MADTTTIKGIIRVVNLDYNKRIVVRYTTDDWVTVSEAVGEYIVGSCDGFSDKFTVELDYSAISGKVGRRLQFCIKYECATNEYWDSNSGKNYVFQCFGPPQARTASSPLSAPVSFKSFAVSVPSAAPVVRSEAFSTFSHSPSALNDEPWLRYL